MMKSKIKFPFIESFGDYHELEWYAQKLKCKYVEIGCDFNYYGVFYNGRKPKISDFLKLLSKSEFNFCPDAEIRYSNRTWYGEKEILRAIKTGGKKEYFNIKVNDYPYGIINKRLINACEFINKLEVSHALYHQFDYPDYYNMPKSISNKLDYGEVDFIRCKINEQVYSVFECRAA